MICLGPGYESLSEPGIGFSSLGVDAHAETTQPHCAHHKKWKLIFNIPVSKERFWISEKLNIYFIMYDFVSL